MHVCHINKVLLTQQFGKLDTIQQIQLTDFVLKQRVAFCCC